jgi:DNA-directed RNA polymerase subunit RPC12/RpoP
MPIDLKKWLPGHRGDRGKPQEEVYVDFAKAPEEPEGPYRARMALSTHVPVLEGIDVSERDVVAGQLQVIYQVCCPCGQRWQSPQFQRMSICPKCSRAVLVEAPKAPTE